MSRPLSWIVLAAAVPLMAACGGRETVASRSAAAYRDAVARGEPIGDEHGGHAAGGDDHGAREAVPDPLAEPTPEGHPRHDPSSAPGTAAGSHGGHEASSTPKQDPHAAHSVAPGAAAEAHAGHASRAAEPNARHDRVTHGAADRSAAPGHDHGTTDRIADPRRSEHGGHQSTLHGAASHAAIPAGGLWGGIPDPSSLPRAVGPPLPVGEQPLTSSAMNEVRPSRTLTSDRADAAAAISVQEALKSSTGEASSPDPDHGAEHPPGDRRR